MSQNNLLEDFKDLVADAPVSTLRQIISFSTNLILEKQHSTIPPPSENEIGNYFKYVPDVLNNPSLDISSDHIEKENDEPITNADAFIDNLQQEVESLGLDKGNSKKVCTQWVIENPNEHPIS